ncbi:PLP-dependent aminotransferase family protein [Paenibacillus urinalis]|uniref:PLP-dependent aminotransferase family protein n=1 Tax=Paenibacillus urinalis TaxID=521520 RepID=A0AAX3MSY4_9BACL|nr:MULTISPECIES: PLP-dependent aminotransferase family protein [Paenibacillus]WDH80725.1 PLP-dependent aminotransferase family protein [Paenibacillus urinalis]WDH96778.1 PLP-dependent aminotransferase family protein [Paenibacillus urinalis]WDI00421.1 PLP-dependent aminotransferase family protein [Paenibacillus urinalis]GAK39095.1 GntR family transcriptional regulator with aminotransferase domain [Paenibacillus sp. TCA20]
MYSDFVLANDRPAYIQVKDYIRRLITTGALQGDQKLPSTRELCGLLHVSRNTVINAYSELEADGYIYTVKGQGHFVSSSAAPSNSVFQSHDVKMNWSTKLNDYARLAEEHDLMKHGIRGQKQAISFTSIAPDEKLFDLQNVKRAFMDRMSLEGDVLLNYGYAKGYKPLIEYLLNYMENKGVDLAGKDLLVTSGFTEGLSLVLSSFKQGSGRILCENPTHHTAIKAFKMHGYKITGVPMERDGINLKELSRELASQAYDLAYLIPSYHNPTGIVMSHPKRKEALRLLQQYHVPIIEDGFNEELRYSGSHIAPLVVSAGSGNNSVIYIGSFSKILFPGLRVGWILADSTLIDYLESVKRARTIHTSTLDQSLLYQYLYNGNFEKYLKRAKTEYKRKHELVVRSCQEWLPAHQLSSDGGLHVFIEFAAGVDTRELLKLCSEQGVLFTPGDIFYTDGRGQNTLRLGFSRVSEADIQKGIQIIGYCAEKLLS